MAKLVRMETDYRFYVAELTDEQLKRFQESDEGADDVMDDVCDYFEFTRDKHGRSEYYLEE